MKSEILITMGMGWLVSSGQFRRHRFGRIVDLLEKALFDKIYGRKLCRFFEDILKGFQFRACPNFSSRAGLGNETMFYAVLASPLWPHSAAH